MRSRLVFFINSADLFLTHRQHLAKGALQKGFEVFVVVPEGAATESLKKLGYQCVPIKMSRKGINPFTEIATIFSLMQILKSLKPDIVHNFTIKCVLYGTIAARLTAPIRIINSITGRGHVFIDQGLKAKVVRRILSFLYRVFFNDTKIQFVFQNGDDQQLYLKNGWIQSSQAVVIAGTGVDLNEFKPSAPEPPEPVKILFAARLLKEKGIAELIQACDLLVAEKLSFQLVICGRLDAGNPSALTASEFEQIKRRPYVLDMGFQSQMAPVYLQSHIVCLPSYAEGLPLTLIEAAASGRPLVATDVPGCRDVVIHGQNGLLVRFGDVPALASALRTLIQSPVQRLAMGRRARESAAARYDRVQIVDQCLSLYSEERSAA